jgi:predicted DNA binding CopG/RHH family protein
MTAKRRDYEDLPDEELPPELDAKVRAMIAQADQDIEDARVNFRWGKAQVDVVKRAAGIIGVPYQTYIKQVVFRQALADIQASSGIVVTSG